MRRFKYLIIMVSLISLHCSHVTEPGHDMKIDDNIKIELLKRIFLLEVNNDWKNAELSYFKATNEDLKSWSTEKELIQKLQDEDSDIIFVRSGILLLSTSSDEGIDNLLIDFLNTHDDGIVQLNAARALAYRGNKAGLSLLQKCAAGEMVLTSSGFEINAAALALLILEEELPVKYSKCRIADPLYLLL